jgi:hypothetical protein
MIAYGGSNLLNKPNSTNNSSSFSIAGVLYKLYIIKEAAAATSIAELVGTCQVQQGS